MAGFLSKDWLDDADLAGGADGRPVTVRRVVTGGPDGEVTLEAEVTGAPGPGPTQLTFTTTYEVAVSLDAGEVAPAVAYMQGRLKAEGDMPTLYAVLSAR